MKRRALTVAAAVLLAVGLTGCANWGAPDSASSPREGRVTLTYSNCGYGTCVYDWKVCVGPDLLMHVNDQDHWIRSSEECS